jgi:hypothetical protein
MNCIETRQTALSLAKESKTAIAAKDLEKVEVLIGKAANLYEYATKWENYYKYEDTTEVDENEKYPPAWCFEKARERSHNTLETLEYYYYTRQSVLEARIQRKREEKLNK